MTINVEEIDELASVTGAIKVVALLIWKSKLAGIFVNY